jgi:DNA-binding NarL/FixJ family response regulator
LRIVIADDHVCIRRGIRLILEERQGWVVCGEAANGQEAVDLVVNLKPDVVVLDGSMPILNGYQASRKIRELVPSTRIVMLSMHDSAVAKLEAREAGAHGYVTKTGEPSELFGAIEGTGLHFPVS